jgi:predicted O-methyltransferase YrrM
MTSRTATSHFSLTAGNARPHQPVADRLFTIAWASIQWPWLLRSLSAGSSADRLALLQELDLPPDSLPSLGSWKADAGFLRLVGAHVLAQRPATVVEFGCGATTLVLARALERAGGGTLVSHDQHQPFVASTRSWLAEHGLDAEIRHAPLLAPPSPWRGGWYATGELPGSIDLLLVDGPHWGVHPFARGAAETLFHRLPVGGVVMLDDGARPGERVVMARWRRRWPNMAFRLVHAGPKGTIVGQRMA